MAWSPTTGTWRHLSPPPPGLQTYLCDNAVQPAAFTGTAILLWSDGFKPLVYELATDQWVTFEGGPHSYRELPSVVWTGNSMIGWSGTDVQNNTNPDDGISFTPTG